MKLEFEIDNKANGKHAVCHTLEDGTVRVKAYDPHKDKYYTSSYPSVSIAAVDALYEVGILK